MKKIILTTACLLFLVSFVFPEMAEAQCAMCRATVENNVSNGTRTFGAGLNKGILYLMVMPYLTLGVLAFFWYKQSKKEQAQREKLSKRLGLG